MTEVKRLKYNLIVQSTTSSSGISSGALVVHGGVGIAQNVHVGGSLTTSSFSVNNTSASTSPTTGALVLLGGLGIGHTTDASAIGNGGAFTVAGGVGIGKRLFVGDTIVGRSQMVLSTPVSSSVGASLTMAYKNLPFTNTVGDTGTWTWQVNSDNHLTLSNVNGSNVGKNVITVQETSGTISITGNVTVSSNALTDSSGTLNVVGDTVVSRAFFRSGSLGAPTLDTRSAGTRIVLDAAVDTTTVDSAIGLSSQGLWLSAKSTSESVSFFAGTRRVGSFSQNGVAVQSLQDSNVLVEIQPNREDKLKEQVFSSTTNAADDESITGMIVEDAKVFKAKIAVNISADANTCSYFEVYGIKRTSGAWALFTENYVGDEIDIDFSITAGGQVQYTIPSIPGFIETEMYWKLETLFDQV